MTAKSATDARLAALDAICAVFDKRVSLSDPGVFDAGLEPRDAAFARRLAYGVMRWYGALDWLAGQMLDHPLKTRDQDVHRLILLGIYQLLKEDTATHAAVHATAGCANRLGKKWAVGLVNAVLRRFLREREQRVSALENSDHRLAHPGWLLDALRNDWPDDWTEIAAANNRQAPLWLRCNLARVSRESMAGQLQSAEFETTANPYAPASLTLSPPAGVAGIPGFAQGLVSVQDAAAQLAAPLLAPAAGERILDACAAPGGKTCHLMELQPALSLTALDRSAKRTRLIKQNLERLGLAAELLTGDGTQPEGWWDGKPYDKILLDAPCSATGVIRRHPEIKWLRDAAQVEEAVSLQERLLDQLWPLLKAGGMLVYATCSVLKCENSRQIEAFLQRHPDARCTGPGEFPGRAQSCGRQILTGEDGMDGFFYAVLLKAA